MLFTMAEFVDSFEIAIACSGKFKAEIKVARLFGRRWEFILRIQGVQECSIPCFRKILKISNQRSD